MDNDLISRAAALNALLMSKDYRDAHDALEQLPAVDAVPVVHGRWEFCGDDDIVCSVCGARYFKKRLMYAYYIGPGSNQMDGFWYCPHCGVLLDGGELNDT